MSFDPLDLELFKNIKYLMHSMHVGTPRGTAYTKEAELLWVGQHYLVIRSGPRKGVRSVEAWSREQMLLQHGNPSKNAMYELALATMNPELSRWNKNYRVSIWRSKGSAGRAKAFAGRRWSKSLRISLIEWVQEHLEDTFEERMAEWVSNRATGHEFSQRLVASFEEDYEVSGVEERDGIVNPAGHTYTVPLSADSTMPRFRFEPKICGDLVEVGFRHVYLNEEEFHIVSKAVKTIIDMRKARLKNRLPNKIRSNT